MHGKKAVTEFLNVDLDIRGDAGDLASFLSSVERSVVVIHHTDRSASLELAQPSVPLEETVMGLVDLIGALEPDARRIWNRLELRSLNVGIQAAAEPHSASFAISAKAIELLAPLQFEIVITVYAPRAA
jgi:hypothetical protein